MWSGLRPALQSLPVRAAFLTQELEPRSRFLSSRHCQSHMPMSPGAANHGHLRLAVYIRSGRGPRIPSLSPCAWRTVGTEPPIPISSPHPTPCPTLTSLNGKGYESTSASPSSLSFTLHRGLEGAGSGDKCLVPTAQMKRLR